MVSQPEYLHLVCVTLSCGELRNAAHLHGHTNAALWVLIFPPEWKLGAQSSTAFAPTNANRGLCVVS